ncbi:MAG: hypothetical protein Q8K86_01540 [Candidatus Nanopelagicaceae bacterium]|nr:hypothetical protein [Candidatus Nanopelagicaceae bacterium]
MIQQIIQEYQAGTGLKKLAIKHHKDWLTVRRILQENGIKIRDKTPRKIPFSEAIKMYQKGFSGYEIAKKFGSSDVSVYAQLQRAGVQVRPPTITSRQYALNLTQLTDLSSELGGYWFGFMLADGYINPNHYRLRCNLSSRDIGHLFLLAKDAGSIQTPKKRTQKGGFSDGRESAYLSLNSKELIECYHKHGWSNFKSGKMNNFHFHDIDVRHMLRGFCDGDGIVTHNNHRYLRIGFCNKHKSIITWIIRRLVKNLNVSQNHIGTHNGIFYVFWAGAPAVTIARWLYTNQMRCLKRKMEKIAKFIF